MIRILVAAGLVAAAAGFAPAAARRHRQSVVRSASAFDVLGAAHSQTLERLQAALEPVAGLTEDDFDLGDGAVGRVRGFEAPDRDVAWCASATIDGGDGQSCFELAAWNSPSVEAPHFYSRVEVVAGGIEVEVDWRPRMDGGYDAAVEASGADYPDPAAAGGTRGEVRAAFARAVLRAEYDAAYFDDDAKAWRAGLLVAAAEEAVSPLAGLVVGGRRQYGGDSAGSVGGPLATCVRFPRDEAGADAAAAACASAAQRFLAWMEAPERSSWMRTRQIYDRDCLVRQYVATAHGERLAARYADKGEAFAFAAATAGRLDMMGHNMMNAGGSEDGERD